LASLAKDTDPQVRLQLAATLGYCEGPQAAEALAQLAWESRGDRFIFAYAMSSVGKGNWETVARTFLQKGGQDGAQSAIDAIVRMAPAFGGDESVARLIAAISQPADGGFAPWQFTAAGALLDALQRQNRSFEALLRSEKQPLQEAAKKLPAVIEAARAAIAGEKTPAELRLAAIPLLGRESAHRARDLELLGSLLVPQSSVELQQAVVASLGSLPAIDTSQQLVKAWRGSTPAVRGQVLDRLLASNTGRGVLLTALEQKTIPAVEIDAARRQRLLQSNDDRERAMKLFAATNTDRARVIEQYRTALELTGDATRGTQLFAKSCAQCHRLKEVGHAVGPDLAALTDKSPESLLVAMLDPNRAVESKFLAYTAVTRDGKSASGMLASETGGSITLVGPEAKSVTIPRDELEELVSSSKSLMPEGIENDLKPQDIADLLAMLRADLPADTPKSFPGNQPKVVAADDQGAFQLKPATCEIHGPSVILESQYGNLGYWGSADDRVVWTVQVPEAGRYEVWGDWACENSTAGNVCRVESLSGSLLFKVAGTGTWDDYRQQKWGELSLPAGKQRITVRSEGKVRGAMIDLRGLELRPVKR
ncbi:MAG TPA: c-type cytochrome, partial [Planctomycetaceae bacterium]|nr:c-type cytochrome [Planctomycetaceae bacterium]